MNQFGYFNTFRYKILYSIEYLKILFIYYRYESGICGASIKETPSDIDLSDIDTCELESQDTNSDETESQDADSDETESQDADSDETESRESPDLDSEDKKIYEGNFENVPTITQSEIRIFLSSTFKGNIIKYFKLNLFNIKTKKLKTTSWKEII